MEGFYIELRPCHKWIHVDCEKWQASKILVRYLDRRSPIGCIMQSAFAGGDTKHQGTRVLELGNWLELKRIQEPVICFNFAEISISVNQ